MPGDILVLRAADGRWLSHRLIGGYPRRGGWRWLTQADVADRPDHSITADQILGKVIGGEDSLEIASIPVAERLLSLRRFLRFVLARLFPQLGAR